MDILAAGKEERKRGERGDGGERHGVWGWGRPVVPRGIWFLLQSTVFKTEPMLMWVGYEPKAACTPVLGNPEVCYV